MNFILRICKIISAITLTLALSSCAVERWFPNDVANGAARLTVNNFGNLLRGLYDDSIYQFESTDKRLECDFRSLATTDKTTIKKGLNGRGLVVSEFSNCIYDFGKTGMSIEVRDSCGTQKTTFFGKVKVSGTRTIQGILTGDKSIPVIPSGSNGVDFHFSRVEFENYRVQSDGLSKAMTIASGSASFDINVHLAKSKESGICRIPLPNLTLKNIRYSSEKGAAETIVLLPGPFGQFQATIDASDLQAQVGVHGASSNSLKGTLSVWGRSITVPTDEPKLDPSFTSKAYEESLTCTEDLATPVYEQCTYEPELAGNLARLTVNNLGNLLFAINEVSPSHPDENCRLNNLLATPNTRVEETTRNAKGEGMVIWDFQKCQFDFGKMGTDVKGTTHFGKVTVSGQIHAFGLLTGDKKTPVVPGEQGVTFEMSEVIFDNYHVKSPEFPPSLNIVSGRAAYNVTVHLEKTSGDLGDDMRVYQKPILNPTFHKISYLEKTVLEINLPKGFLPGDLQGTFRFDVDESDFSTQVEKFGGKENTLEGSFSFLGQKIHFPSGTGLRPDSPGTIEKETTPVRDETPFDNIEDLVTDGIARLTINNLGNLMLALNEKEHETPECNFSNFAKSADMEISPDDGGNYRTVSWNFKECKFDFGPSGLSIDGGKKHFDGSVIISGQKTVHGFWTGDDEMMVIPGKDGVVLKFENVTFDNYLFKSNDFDKFMKMVEGRVAFEVKVHLAKDLATELCIEPVQNLTFKNIRYAQTKVELQGEFAGGRLNEFKTTIESSNFDAQVGYGKYPELDNGLSGDIQIFNRKVLVPTDGLGLNPKPDHMDEFENALRAQKDLATTDRNAMFVCKPYEEVEASTTARLLVLNTGSIAQESFDEWLKPKEIDWSRFNLLQTHKIPFSSFSKCGFDSNSAKLRTQDPRSDAIEGEPGHEGRVKLKINRCEVVNQKSPAEYPPDCLGTKTVFEGNVIVSGTQVVEGMRKPVFSTPWEKTGWEFFSSITPNHPLSVMLDLHEIEPRNFSSYYVNLENPVPKAKLTLVSGKYSAQLFPVLAAKKGSPCEFYRSTPVAGMQIDIPTDLYVQLDFHLKKFNLTRKVRVETAHLKAQNGFYQGDGNFLVGDISVNGQTFYFNRIKLNPDFEQIKFDKSYDCREELPIEDDLSIERIIQAHPGWKPDCNYNMPCKARVTLSDRLRGMLDTFTASIT